MLRKRKIVRMAALGLSFIALSAGGAGAGEASGRHSVWRGDCGPYGHKGPTGGCIPGGPYGAGNYYFLGPDYQGSWPFVGPPNYGAAATGGEQPDYGVGYWGTRSYDIPGFQ